MTTPTPDRPVGTPIEPPASPWDFSGRSGGASDLVAFGADLAPGTLLAAYRAGVFPMPIPERTTRSDRGALAWFSPVDRAILPLDGLRVTRSMRRSARGFEVTVDRAFTEVMRGCADPSRDGGWIDQPIIEAYTRLHELGWAHSVEVWTHDGELAGGVYGVAIGGLFCGESMFHRRRDASKVALMALVDLLRHDGDPGRLLDVQWATPHLTSLGVMVVGRAAYLRLLARALARPLPTTWAG